MTMTSSDNVTMKLDSERKRGSTENARPETGRPRKDERTENAGLKMRDQMSGVENSASESKNAGPENKDRKWMTNCPQADYLMAIMKS